MAERVAGPPAVADGRLLKLGVSGANAYLWTMSRKPTRPKSEPKSAPSADVAWIITRIGATPAKYVVRFYAPDEKTAIAKAIEDGVPIRNSRESWRHSCRARNLPVPADRLQLVSV